MTEVSVTRFKEPKGNLFGLASFTYNGQFLVQNIRIVQSEKNEIFVSMPSYKRQNKENGESEYKQYVNPVTREFREELYSAILKQYEKGGGKVSIGEDEPDISFDGYFNPYTREGSSIRGLVNVVIGGKFAVNGIGIYQTKKENFLMASMPSYKTSKTDKEGNPVYKAICYSPKSEFSKIFYKMIIDIAKANEKAHFNEQGVIVQENGKNLDGHVVRGQSSSEDGFLDISEDMMEDLPFMLDETVPPVL